MPMTKEVTIQDVFDRFLPEMAEVSNFSPRQYLAVKCIQACRTAKMGAHVSECKSCHATVRCARAWRWMSGLISNRKTY
mgnify:CR=1 FL=1